MVLDPDLVMHGGHWDGQRLARLYEEAYTPWEWFPELFLLARRLGLIPSASVFDVGALTFLEEIGCPIYKIASFEITDLRLIRAVAATHKHLVISTGMADCYEIQQAIDASAGCGKLTLLKCTSAYPADCSDSNLHAMNMLQRVYQEPVGLSDHTPGIAAAVVASSMGATMIEKHLTLRRADGGPDSAFSMEPEEFKALVVGCRQATAVMGKSEIGPTTAEEPQLALRRSLYFLRDMEAGAVIESGDLVTARPAIGLSPHRLDGLVGKVLTKPVAKGEPVTNEAFNCTK
jgi:N-acetylneuraminate synthase